MLQISEWLPNPKGVDAKGEWVELQNNGTSGVSTAGWVLRNEKGKSFGIPSGTLSPGGFLVLRKPELSLSFRNTNGGLSLFDGSGGLVDQAKFLGVAQEEKTFGRGPAGFSWMKPTPGAVNQMSSSSFEASVLPLGRPIYEPVFPILPLVFFPILISAFLLYTVKQDEVLSKLFFKGDEPDSQNEALAYTQQDDDWVED